MNNSEYCLLVVLVVVAIILICACKKSKEPLVAEYGKRFQTNDQVYFDRS